MYFGAQVQSGERQILRARKHEPPLLNETRKIVLAGMQGPRTPPDGNGLRESIEAKGLEDGFVNSGNLGNSDNDLTGRNIRMKSARRKKIVFAGMQLSGG